MVVRGGLGVAVEGLGSGVWGLGSGVEVRWGTPAEIQPCTKLNLNFIGLQGFDSELAVPAQVS